jgi:hypothetical protein
MTIEATVIADSISDGNRLTTLQLRYPRFIHAEFMTHRMFSRNASSSRAIPVERMIEDLKRDPATPVYWGGAQKGMQAGAELIGNELASAKWQWSNAMYQAIRSAEIMMEAGLHKQIANRILEPWAHINVIVTATDWDNFFALRRHPDAQPEIKALADRMHEAMERSVPDFLLPGEWHLPYTGFDTNDRLHGDFLLSDEDQRKVSVARCARVSYMTHDGKRPTVEADIALHDKLVGAVPLHASPAEHQATPDSRYSSGMGNGRWKHEHEHGNLRGWRQYRKQLEATVGA